MTTVLRTVVVAWMLAVADAALGCGSMIGPVWSAPAGVGAFETGWPLGSEDQFQWGSRNVRLEAGDEGPEVTVFFPKGSINPGNPTAPEGGAGFLDRFSESFDEACLRYEILFETDFVFGEGGKLPGLFGGVDMSGCTLNTSNGFSARYMWGRRGIGFLYPYFADRLTACGDMLGTGKFNFTPGIWTEITQRVKLNDPSRSDGEVDIWQDGKHVFDARNLRVRQRRDVQIEGLMFSTFFGGSDVSRASPADQRVRFRRFELFVPDNRF